MTSLSSCCLWFLLLKILSPLEVRSLIPHYCLFVSSQMVKGWRGKERVRHTFPSLWGPHSSGQRVGVPFLQSARSCLVLRVLVNALGVHVWAWRNSRKNVILIANSVTFWILCPFQSLFSSISRKELHAFFLSHFRSQEQGRGKNSYSIWTAATIFCYLFWSEEKIVILRCLSQLKTNGRIWN